MPKRNNRRKFKKPPRNREVQLKSKDQEYAIIVEAYGDYRFLVKCDDGVERIGRVRGSLRSRIPFFREDYVLIALRPDFNSFTSITNKNAKDNVDIILKYFPQEVLFLKNNSHFLRIGDDVSEDLQDHEFDDIINENEGEENQDEIQIDVDDLDDI